RIDRGERISRPVKQRYRDFVIIVGRAVGDTIRARAMFVKRTGPSLRDAVTTCVCCNIGMQTAEMLSVEGDKAELPLQLKRRERPRFDVLPRDQIIATMTQQRLGEGAGWTIRQVADTIALAWIVEAVAKPDAKVSRSLVSAMNSVEITVSRRRC